MIILLSMDTALAVHRFQFAFTVTFHYLFPQLTMGLALLIAVLKTIALKTGNEHYNNSARFWAKIFAINFAVGVVTGIPMEFQFGTNWSGFSHAAGGVIGQTLAMEGVYSFFLESSFLGLFLFGERILGPIGHWGRPWRCGLARGSPAFLSWRPTPGCSIPPGTNWGPEVKFNWTAYGACCPTRGFGGNTRTR